MGTGRKTGKKKKRKKSAGKAKLTAKTADKYELYQESVQDPDPEIAVLTERYRELRGRDPRHLREDFCGTALLSSRWIRLGDDYTAEAYDNDPGVVVWGMARNFRDGDFSDERCRIFVEDVREPSRQPPDVRVAGNFSYWTFKERGVLLDYFRRVRDDLARGGIFVIDVYGGSDAPVEMSEDREIAGGYTYTWQQKRYRPGTGDYDCRIHFSFPDGSRLKNAFRYDWRLWTMPELKDVLADAGFDTIRTYWEGTALDGETGNGEFLEDVEGENVRAWLAYVVARR